MIERQSMDAVLTHDLHAARDRRGACFTDGNTWYESWQKYLNRFDHVHVLARVRREEAIPDHWRRLDGERVTIFDLHDVGTSPMSWFGLRKNKDVIRHALRMPGALILRAGLVGNLAYGLRPKGKPFALEVGGDPFDVFSKQAFRHPLRPVVRMLYVWCLKRQCRRATAVSYVTESALQKRYPPSASAFATHYSSIDLSPEWYVPEIPPLEPDKGAEPVSLVCVGNFYQMYKGQDDLIEATALCRGQGVNVRLRLIGSGRHLPDLQRKARDLNIGDCVEFEGALPPGREVRERIDRSDVFILASRQEGLPRAMIEAMARGKPCIGTTVGGIPELLAPSCLAPPNRPDLLAGKIMEFVRSPALRREMAVRNLAKAHEYEKERLDARRSLFYETIASQTEAWERRVRL